MKTARALALFALLAWPLAARATTSSCATAMDGTPCIGPCITMGMCTAGLCVPSALRPDGAPCASEDICTVGDTCLAGACQAGTPRSCPDKDACNIGFCNPHVGCAFKNICPPDLSTVDLATDDADVAGDMGTDMALQQRDFSGPMDFAGVDLTGADLCTVPIGSEFFSCDNPPDGFFADVDGGGDASAGLPFHVRGSRVGDCAFGGGNARDTMGVALLLLALVAVAWRSRRAS